MNIKISILKRIFKVYTILGKNFGNWISPIITGALILLLRIIVFLGSIIDYVLFIVDNLFHFV